MSGGITEKLRGSLENYLERSAAELDERGAVHTERAAELDAEQAELDQAEADLRERRHRIVELTPIQRELDRVFDRTLADLAARAANVAAQVTAVQERLRRIADGEAQLADRERAFTEKSDRVRIDQRRLAERERELHAVQRELMQANFAGEGLADRRRQLDEREKELETRRLKAGLETQMRRDEVERRERELAEREAVLDRRTEELRAYVAQLQALQRHSGSQAGA